MDRNVTWEPERRNYSTRAEHLSASSGINAGRVGTVCLGKRSVLEKWAPTWVVGKMDGGFMPSYLWVKDILKRTGIPACTGLWWSSLGHNFVRAKPEILLPPFTLLSHLKKSVWSLLRGKRKRESVFASLTWCLSFLPAFPSILLNLLTNILCNLIKSFVNFCEFAKIQ